MTPEKEKKIRALSEIKILAEVELNSLGSRNRPTDINERIKLAAEYDLSRAKYSEAVSALEKAIESN